MAIQFLPIALIRVFPLGPLGLLIVPAFLAVLIILLVKGGKGTRCIIGGIFLLAILFPFSMFVFMRPSPRPIHEITVPHITHNILPVVSQWSPPVKDPALWQPNLEAEMIADVYSSKESAAFGLGVQLQETIKTATGANLEKIIIAESSEKTDMGLLERLRQGVQTAFSDIPVFINDLENSEANHHFVTVNLSVINESSYNLVIPEHQGHGQIRTKQILPLFNRAGTVQAVVETTDGKFIKEVKYDCRPWLDDMQPLQSSGDLWQPMVFRSYDTALTKEQAIGQVTEQACQYIAQQFPGHLIASGGVAFDDLQSHGLIIDEYAQKFQGLSGPIWRAAMLLDVSPERLAPLRSKVVIQQHQIRKSWVRLAFSLGGMIMLICLVYIILNTLTKGYYSARLAILAVLLVILLSGFLLILK